MTSSASTSGANKRACRVVLLRMNVSFHLGSFNVESLESGSHAVVHRTAMLPARIVDDEEAR